MKKLMSLLVLVSVSMFVVGCGEGDKKTDSKSTVKTPEKTTVKESKEK